jgi:alpha-L-fucosidase
MIDGSGYWCSADSAPEATIELPRPVQFNVVRIREHIPLGQRIEAFAVDVFDGGWRTIGESTSVGSCRIIRIQEPVRTSRVRLRITQSPVPPAISHFGLYEEQL